MEVTAAMDTTVTMPMPRHLSRLPRHLLPLDHLFIPLHPVLVRPLDTLVINSSLPLDSKGH
jgi:hypothetical protein